MLWLFGHTVLGILIIRGLCDSSKCGIKLLNDYDKVPDSAFSATSYFIPPDSSKKKADFSAKAARESYDKENQEYAWCPLNQVETSLSEYLEIDLGRLTLVKVVQTKGRFAQGAGKEFTPFYRIRYSRDSKQQWRDYKKFKDKGFQDILNGPNDAFLDAFETLDPPIIARLVRIFPYSVRSKRVCLKLQLFGCDFTNGVLEYQMLQGTAAIISHTILPLQHQAKQYSDANHLCLDNGYDGHNYEGQLQGGLGVLTDGATGVDLTNKTREVFDFVCWFKDSVTHMTDFISVTFIFLNDRDFTSVKLYSFSNPPMQVDYFSRIHILFSDDNQTYKRRIIKTDILHLFRQEDHSLDIDLQGCYGRYVKINLYFQSQWLLLSEVVFRSESRHTEEKDTWKIMKPSTKEIATNRSSELPPITIRPKKVQYKTITTIPIISSDRPVNLEIIYLLSILLCLLLGVITIICSFWMIIKRKKSRRKKIIKKQALALCSQSPFIPYSHNSNSLHCISSSLPPVNLSSRGVFPSYTVDRRNYTNGSLRSGYHSHSSMLDQNGITNKHCNGDPGIYASIVGSDNDSSLSPEYATTSVTNEGIFPNSYSDTPTSYLPPPIEPIRSNDYSSSMRGSNDHPSLYYHHQNTIKNTQDSMSIWRINTEFDRSYHPNQTSFSDPPYLKYNSNTSSKYTELPCIDSHF